MKKWDKIEEGWYERDGDIVQKFYTKYSSPDGRGIGWYAWAMDVKTNEGLGPFRTREQAIAALLKET